VDWMLNCRFVLFVFVCSSCVLWICVHEVFIGVVRFESWMGWLTLVICRFLICPEIIFSLRFVQEWLREFC
jgi:hypothetical protein